MLLNTVIDVAQVLQVPLYLAGSCMVFSVRLWSSPPRIFLGVCFRKYLRIQHSLVRQWIHVGFRLRGFCKNFTRLKREGGRSCSSPRADVEGKQPSSHSCFIELRTGCCMPFVCNDRCRVVDGLAQFIDGCGRPVLLLRREFVTLVVLSGPCAQAQGQG